MNQSLRFQVFKRDNFRCQYCGRDSEEVILEVDHVTPRSKNGSDDIGNLITSCRECNRGKSNIEVITTDENPYEIEFKKLCSEGYLIFDQIYDLKKQLQQLYTKYRENKIKQHTILIKNTQYDIDTITEERLRNNYPDSTWTNLHEFKVTNYKFIGFLENEILHEESKNEVNVTFNLDKRKKSYFDGVEHL